ncbi:hypothetical protein BDF19DRAFT_420016 [Syncephalis fuscata]|nr:hypothetical protein BDF19DRAFT_420016 [Syncephalis fuscata]
MLQLIRKSRHQWRLLLVYLLLLVLLSASLTVTAEPVCAALKTPSTLCPDITFNTTVTDASATDKTIKDLLDKISREGAGSAGADCFLSIRRTLCLTHYRKCDPAANATLTPVCTSVRKHVFEVCAKGGAFADTTVIKANLDDKAFGDDKDCIALAVGTNAVDAKPVNASATKTSEPAPTSAVPLRTCSLFDMAASYKDHCAQQHTRTLLLQKKLNTNCNDTNVLAKTERTLLCPCSSNMMRNYTSPCAKDGKQMVISYQPDIRNQHCDRQLAIPQPFNATCSFQDDLWDVSNGVYRDFRDIRWSMRTGCAPNHCFNKKGKDTRKKHDPDCAISPEGCKNWRVTKTGAHIDALNSNLTSFLEFEISSLDTVMNPAVIFTFNVSTNIPIDVGLRAKLDGVERMPLVSNQTNITGYEIALVPGKKHQIRWEWLGLDGHQGNASIHEIALRDTFAEINTRPSMPHKPTLSSSASPPISTTTPIGNNTVKAAANSTDNKQEQLKLNNNNSNTTNNTNSTNITLADQTAVVTLNSSELSSNINHQPTRHQSSNVTTAQKPQNPFTVANVVSVANAENATAETIDEVAVSRRFSGGVFVTTLFIIFAVIISSLFLWRKKMGHYLGIANLVNRWLQRRYAVVPTAESLSPQPAKNVDDQDAQFEMNHFQVIDDEDILEFGSLKDHLSDDDDTVV